MKIVYGISTISIITALAQHSVAQQPEACIEGGFTLEFHGDCTFANIISSFEDIFYDSDCSHSVKEEFCLHLGLPTDASDDEVHAGVRSICKTAWDNAAKVSFDNTHMKDEQFSQLFYNGGTEWNEEVETNLETGESTNVLKDDASQVKQFYNSLGQTAHVEWPGELPNFDLDKCNINAAMCCWPQDRQANDGNGNCNKPYDENCYDKDPADNTDLCFVDLSRSPQANKLNDTGFLNFPHDNSNGEGPVHCHGFAWANDKYDPSNRFKANNLFFVSMYDHMYQRGYVGNIPGAPMCACVEQMPTTTRSDCTQIDVDESYKIVHYPDSKSFTAILTDIEIDFNSCQGRYNRNNDLHAYVARLAHEGKLSNDQRAGLDKYLVGNGRCSYATDFSMGEKGYVRGFHHDANEWFKVAGSHSVYVPEIGREAFRTLLADSAHNIVWRICATCIPSHQSIYYKRLTPVPAELDLLDYFLNGWKQGNNVENEDFKIYSTFEDAVNDENAWQFYSFNNDRGFPYESGPTERVRDQWRSFSRNWGRTDVAFYVMKSDGGATRFIGSSSGLTSLDIGDTKLEGDVVTKDGTYYITASGYDIWSYSDQFHFLQVPSSGDVTATVFLSSLRRRHSWTKAGVMIRETLDANSAHFSCLMTGNQGVVAQYRHETGRYSGSQAYSTNIPIVPTWIRVTRRGDTFTCSKSEDNYKWEQVGNPVTMGISFEAFHTGMALVSHDSWRISEAVFENFELDAFYFPSASPTVSKSPTYNFFVDATSLITNYESGRRIYASAGKWWESGVGGSLGDVRNDNKWKFLQVACDLPYDCYYIKNEASGRCLYAQDNRYGESGVGAGPCQYEDNKWYLGKAECDKGECHFILNARSKRRLYAELGKTGESGYGASNGEYKKNQKWIIELAT